MKNEGGPPPLGGYLGGIVDTSEPPRRARWVLTAWNDIGYAQASGISMNSAFYYNP